MNEIQLAINVATKREDLRTYKVGAVAIRKDGTKVFSRNEGVKVPTPSAHAEARLMKKAGHGSTVYVARVIADGSPALARPCPRCMALLVSYKVKKVHYTTSDGIETITLN